MNNSLKMVKLDFITSKTIINKFFLIYMSLLTLGFSLFTGNVTFSMCFGMFMGFIYAFAPFSYSILNNIDLLYITLGIKRKDVVTGRFIFSGLTIVISVFVSIILGIIGALIGRIWDIPLVLNTGSIVPVLFAMCCVLLLTASELFFSFFKSSKGKVIHILVAATFFLVIMALVIVAMLNDSGELGVTLGNILITLYENIWYIVGIFAVITIIWIYISYRLSVKVYNNREF